jgi:hypothetical protein
VVLLACRVEAQAPVERCRAVLDAGASAALLGLLVVAVSVANTDDARVPNGLSDSGATPSAWRRPRLVNAPSGYIEDDILQFNQSFDSVASL